MYESYKLHYLVGLIPLSTPNSTLFSRQPKAALETRYPKLDYCLLLQFLVVWGLPRLMIMVKKGGVGKTDSKLRIDRRASVSGPLRLYSNDRIRPSIRGLASGLNCTQSRYTVSKAQKVEAADSWVQSYLIVSNIQILNPLCRSDEYSEIQVGGCPFVKLDGPKERKVGERATGTSCSLSKSCAESMFSEFDGL
jgi:hypothetical protein